MSFKEWIYMCKLLLNIPFIQGLIILIVAGLMIILGHFSAFEVLLIWLGICRLFTKYDGNDLFDLDEIEEEEF